MAIKMNGVVETREFDNIIYDSAPTLETFTVTLRANSGELKRGTVLGLTETGDYVVLGTSGVTSTANAILCDDVTVGTSTVKAEAYRAGHFNSGKLTVASGYTLTATDKENLRKAGILLSKAVNY